MIWLGPLGPVDPATGRSPDADPDAGLVTWRQVAQWLPPAIAEELRPPTEPPPAPPAPAGLLLLPDDVSIAGLPGAMTARTGRPDLVRILTAEGTSFVL